MMAWARGWVNSGARHRATWTNANHDRNRRRLFLGQSAVDLGLLCSILNSADLLLHLGLAVWTVGLKKLNLWAKNIAMKKRVDCADIVFEGML